MKQRKELDDGIKQSKSKQTKNSPRKDRSSCRKESKPEKQCQSKKNTSPLGNIKGRGKNRKKKTKEVREKMRVRQKRR